MFTLSNCSILHIFVSSLEVDMNFDLQSDEGTNTPPTQIVMDEDMDDMNDAKKLWTSSELGSPEVFTNVCEQEDSESNSDNEGESDNSLTIYTESTFSLSHEIDKYQVVNTMTEAQQLDYMAGEFTAAEGNVQSDLVAGDSTHKLVTEFGITSDKKELTEKHQPQISSPMSRDNQTPEETSSESDEESPGNYSTTEQLSQCESVDNKAEPFLPMTLDFAEEYYVRDDMKEFTEEDQENIEEGLADYPSDLSHSETEEPNENATAQSFTLIDTSASSDHFPDRLEELSDAENVILHNTGSPVLDQNSGIKCLEKISASANTDLSFKRGSYDEEDTQKSFDRNTEEDTQNKENAGVLHDVYDQAGYISDSSSDDHSSSEEEMNFLSSVKQDDEQNHIAQQNYLAEDITRMDDDIDYLYPDTRGVDNNGPEEQNVRCLIFCDVKEKDLTNTSSISYYEESNTEPTELHRSIESVQSDTAVKGHDKSSSEASYNVEDSKSVLSEMLRSSALLINEDNLWLDEYDWDLSGDNSFKINLGEAKNEDYTEEALDEFNIDDVKEENDRDWELEKTRIEAFYRFYGDQPELEDEGGKHYTERTSILSGCLFFLTLNCNGLQVSAIFIPFFSSGRNHKVTFRLDQESSEDDEDSDR